MFAFHADYKKSRDLPENYTPSSVVYTGTHDNNTVRGWFENDLTAIERQNMLDYFGRNIESREASQVMIELALRSSANVAIIALQDLLGLGSEARMNRPSTIEGNWCWRLSAGELTGHLAKRLLRMTRTSGR